MRGKVGYVTAWVDGRKVGSVSFGYRGDAVQTIQADVDEGLQCKGIGVGLYQALHDYDPQRLLLQSPLGDTEAGDRLIEAVRRAGIALLYAPATEAGSPFTIVHA